MSIFVRLASSPCRALAVMARTRTTLSTPCWQRVFSASADETHADQAGIHRTPIVEKLWQARVEQPGKLDTPVHVSEDGTAAWPPSHSRLTVDYNFTTDPLLRERYRNPWGKIRVGKLLEDLDAFAGNVVLEHCRSAHGLLPPWWVAMVTASVDRIVIRREQESLEADLQAGKANLNVLSGSVAYAGASSMEVVMKAQFVGKSTPYITARFTFVARDTRKAGTDLTGKPWSVSRVVPETPEEIAAYQEAEQRQLEKKKARKAALAAAQSGIPQPVDDPTARAREELLEELLSESVELLKMPCVIRPRAHDAAVPVLMSQSKLSNSLICQPQQRNTAGRVFGGFLMRRAFELAFATAYVFLGKLPMFLEVDEVTFKQPVEVGNLLQLDSRVLFTSVNKGPHNPHNTGTLNPSQRALYVEVVAYVTSPEHRRCKVSNTFNFTFLVDASHATPHIVPDSMECAQRMIARMYAEAAQNQADSNTAQKK